MCVGHCEIKKPKNTRTEEDERRKKTNKFQKNFLEKRT